MFKEKYKKLFLIMNSVFKKTCPERTYFFISRIGLKNYVQCFIAQRILRINSQVPWPCHWSSSVGGVSRIKLKTFPPFPGFGIGQYIQAVNGINIGTNVRLGPGVKLISANHDLLDFEKHLNVDPIVIGDNCWIGANAIILPGVSLGNHVIVGAGAVVTKSFFEDDVVVAGNPAQIVKNLDRFYGDWNHVRFVDSDPVSCI
jgi:acetyltransferase-like isoleucine patch superfamily enzyme